MVQLININENLYKLEGEDADIAEAFDDTAEGGMKWRDMMQWIADKDNNVRVFKLKYDGWRAL